jgi:hypothetical protein
MINASSMVCDGAETINAQNALLDFANGAVIVNKYNLPKLERKKAGTDGQTERKECDGE